jgi:very-short-patch-repair endonuclease
MLAKIANMQLLLRLVLWEALKGKKLRGLKFRRQHPIGSYIADFYCHEVKLVVEIDGKYHLEADQQEYDRNRTAVLKEVGVQLLRFQNEKVLNNLADVLMEIEHATLTLS